MSASFPASFCSFGRSALQSFRALLQPATCSKMLSKALLTSQCVPLPALGRGAASALPRQTPSLESPWKLPAQIAFIASLRAKRVRRGETSALRGTTTAQSLTDHRKLRVLLIIHGYPPLYNAGSEVYTQTLARALKQKGHEVWVFCREEDTIAPYFRIREEEDSGVTLRIINLPNLRDRYTVPEVDEAVSCLMQEYKPDVVHCGHLNHLSMSLVERVARENIPFVPRTCRQFQSGFVG